MDYLKEKHGHLVTRKELIRAQRVILDMQERGVDAELERVEQALRAMQAPVEPNA